MSLRTPRRASAWQRLALATSLASTLLLAAQAASAAPGTVILSGGEVLTGDITEVVPGDRLTIATPGGVRVVGWSSIGSWSYSVGISIGAGAGTPAPAPAPVYTAPAPAPTYAPAPAPAYAEPAPAYGAPAPRRYRAFRPRFTVGARVGSITPGGALYKTTLRGNGTNGTLDPLYSSDLIGNGLAGELDFGWRFAPGLVGYVGFELSFHGRGTANKDIATDLPIGAWVGAGIQGTTNPRGLGLFFDLATGGRIQRVPYALNGATYGATFSGWDIARVGLGVSLSQPENGTRYDLYGWWSGGFHTNITADGADCSTYAYAAGCTSIGSDGNTARTFHTAMGLAVAATFDTF